MSNDKDPINEGLAKGAMIVVYILVFAFLAFLIFTTSLAMWEGFLWIVENYGVSKWDFWKRWQ